MNKVRLGIIGCGGIMDGFHAEHLKTFDDIEVVAVADPVEERRAAVAKKLGAKKLYADHRALYDGEHDLDAVYICVPPSCHEGTEEPAVERGWSFLVEKPMTLSADHADALAAAIAKKGIVTQVGFQDRYLDVTDRMRAELPKMQTGIVYGSWIGGIPGVAWWRKMATSGGQLVEQNIHLVDMLRYLFGEPKTAYAAQGRGIITQEICPGYDVPDYSTAVITFESGVIATLFTACYIGEDGSGIRSGLTIIGRDQSMEYDLRSSLRVCKRGEETLLKVKVDQGMIEDRAFIDAVKKHDPAAVRSPYGDAAKSLKLALAINASMSSGQPVQL